MLGHLLRAILLLVMIMGAGNLWPRIGVYLYNEPIFLAALVGALFTELLIVAITANGLFSYYRRKLIAMYLGSGFFVAILAFIFFTKINQQASYGQEFFWAGVSLWVGLFWANTLMESLARALQDKEVHQIWDQTKKKTKK